MLIRPRGNVAYVIQHCVTRDEAILVDALELRRRIAQTLRFD